MSYELQFDVIDKILRVEIRGNRTAGDLSGNAIAAWSKVATVCNENKLSRILVVSHATGKYPSLNAYEINSVLEECGIERSWKIAFVNLDMESYQDIEFGEIVAVNRGFQVKVFPTEDAARAWL
ncbi:MAG: hypothetical protein ACRETO_03355 [Gammaproteobacteria bacterium]